MSAGSVPAKYRDPPMPRTTEGPGAVKEGNIVPRDTKLRAGPLGIAAELEQHFGCRCKRLSPSVHGGMGQAIEIWLRLR
jgi:hypothetical protein